MNIPVRVISPRPNIEKTFNLFDWLYFSTQPRERLILFYFGAVIYLYNLYKPKRMRPLGTTCSMHISSHIFGFIRQKYSRLFAIAFGEVPVAFFVLFKYLTVSRFEPGTVVAIHDGYTYIHYENFCLKRNS